MGPPVNITWLTGLLCLSVSDRREVILALSSDPTTDTPVTLRGSNSASATPRVPSMVHTHLDSAHLQLRIFRKCFFEMAPAILTDKGWVCLWGRREALHPHSPEGQGCWDSMAAQSPQGQTQACTWGWQAVLWAPDPFPTPLPHSGPATWGRYHVPGPLATNDLGWKVLVSSGCSNISLLPPPLSSDQKEAPNAPAPCSFQTASSFPLDSFFQ